MIFPHLQVQSNATQSPGRESWRLQGAEYPLESNLQVVSLAKSAQSAESNSDSPVSPTSSNPTSYASLEASPFQMKEQTAVTPPLKGPMSDTSDSSLLNVSRNMCLEHQCQACGLKCKTPGQLKYVYSVQSTVIDLKFGPCANTPFSVAWM